MHSQIATVISSPTAIFCVGIYAVLVQNIAVGDDITVAIWECMGYTVLLCYTLFKTGSLAKSLFGAH